MDNIDGGKVLGAVRRIDVDKVQCAMNNMKNGKACGPFVFVLNMLKAGWKSCLKS